MRLDIRLDLRPALDKQEGLLTSFWMTPVDRPYTVITHLAADSVHGLGPDVPASRLRADRKGCVQAMMQTLCHARNDTTLRSQTKEVPPGLSARGDTWHDLSMPLRAFSSLPDGSSRLLKGQGSGLLFEGLRKLPVCLKPRIGVLLCRREHLIGALDPPLDGCMKPREPACFHHLSPSGFFS